MSTGRIIIIFTTLLALLVGAASSFSLSPGRPGTGDFIQYWSAWQLMRRGANPYDAQLLEQIQSATLKSSHGVTFPWIPPWVFLALSPVLSLPFGQAAAVWIAVGFGLLLLVSIVLPLGLGVPRVPPLVATVVTVLFFPILDSLRLGQLGVVFAASISLFLYFQRSGALLLAGVSLLPLSFKPHLFFLLVIPGILWLRQLPARNRRLFLAGVVGSFSLLVAACAIVRPSVCKEWLTALVSRPVGTSAVYISDWQTTTLVTWIRIVIADLTGTLVMWPMWVVPLCGVVGSIYLLHTRRYRIEWETLMPPLLCLSLGTCNYGWVFDQSVLVVCQMALVCDLFRPGDRRGVILRAAIALVIQSVCLGGSIARDTPQHLYAWVPWAYLLLFVHRLRQQTL